MNNRLFRISLFLSLIIHVFFAWKLSGISATKKHHKKPSLEVTYQEIETKKIKKEPVQFTDLNLVKEKKSFSEKLPDMINHKDTISDIGGAIADISKINEQLPSEKKRLTGIKTLDVESKITASFIKPEKMSDPKYLSYNHNMSQLIKKLATSFLGASSTDSGEVYLTFILGSNGILKQVQIIENKTQANDFLKSIALRSVQASSPFPPFPVDLNYPELTFSVLISFN